MWICEAEMSENEFQDLMSQTSSREQTLLLFNRRLLTFTLYTNKNWNTNNIKTKLLSDNLQGENTYVILV